MPRRITSKGLSYKILEVLKEGPHKQVYKALRKEADTGIHQKVLLKIFSSGDNSYQGELESLIQNHSIYCARLLGFETFSGQKALVLEYIEGMSLHQLLQNFHLSQLEKELVLKSIYKGLLDLQKEGLSHGDLSLDNVLINQDGLVKLIDFGRGNYQLASQGTLPFVAPEVLQGARPNFLSDLYALGVVEYFLNHPHKLSDIQKPKVELENAYSVPCLLSEDPQGRCFSRSKSCSKEDLKISLASLSYKVKDFLSSLETKKFETQKISKSLMSFFNPLRFTKQLLLLMFFGLFAGASSFSKIDTLHQGFLKVSTNAWTFVEVNGFKSYTPFYLSLPAGWQLVRWKNQQTQGEKWIYIKSKKTFFLNDKSLRELF
ncbi:MAG: serine/threonine protein kinase [Bdellovibrionales bacterium]